MRNFVFLIFSLSIVACGYRPMLANVPDTLVLVSPVKNHTSFAGVAVPLTMAVQQKLKSSGVEVAKRARAGAARLKIEITRIRNYPGVLGISEGRVAAKDVVWEMDLLVELVDVDGKKMFGPKHATVDGRNLTTGGLSCEQFAGEKTRSRLVFEAANRITSIVIESLSRF